jgi:hypothetical protein
VVTVDPHDPVAYRLAPSQYIAGRLGELGIGDEHLIVGYDDEGGHFVARLWLALAYYGKADRLRILEGGWSRCGLGLLSTCRRHLCTRNSSLMLATFWRHSRLGRASCSTCGG